MNAKRLTLVVILILVLIFSVGCDGGEVEAGNDSDEAVAVESSEDIPNVKVAYVFTNHQTPLMVAAEKAEAFKSEGVYFVEKANRQKYTLMKEDMPIANIELVVMKSGSESMTMLGQKHVELALASSAANMAAIDKGTPVKMLCPVHTEGIGLVAGVNSEMNDWESFVKIAKASDSPIKVGYHSPTSAPLILFLAAAKENGLTVTGDSQDQSADILTVDLKGTNNLLPSLVAKQVDAWVGPSPYPELAETENAGKLILDMKHLPPEGKWYDFPCCVASAHEDLINENPEVVAAFTELMTISANYANNNKDEAAKITADFTGVSEEAAKKSSIKYTTDPTETWLSNLGLVYNALKVSDKFNQDFVEKDYDEVQESLFDFTFVKGALE